MSDVCIRRNENGAERRGLDRESCSDREGERESEMEREKERVRWKETEIEREGNRDIRKREIRQRDRE